MKQFGRLFFRSLPRVNTPLIFQNKQHTAKVGLATLGLSLATWFSTNKIFSEEVQIL